MCMGDLNTYPKAFHPHIRVLFQEDFQMRVYDIYKTISPSGKATRIAIVGSCRVTDPFEDLVRRGHAAAVASVSAAALTLGEIAQIMEWSCRLRNIPAAFAPVIFDKPEMPKLSLAEVTALTSVEVVIIEISGLTQFRCGDLCLQQNYFYRQFVSRYGAALMPWYRVLSTGVTPSEELIDSTLAALSTLPPDEFETAQTIVRGTSIETWDLSRLQQGLAELALPAGAALGIVTHFVVPGLKGSGMDERHKLIQTVGAAAAMEGIPLFNPSGLVRAHGREIALEDGGKDIYHYAPGFHPVVLRAMLNFADSCGRMNEQVKRNHTEIPVLPPPGTMKLATQLNEELCDIYEKRLSRLGLEGSGLYEHYNELLSLKEILGMREVGLANLVLYSLPAFTSYHVPRAGLGELPLLLAYEGLQVVAFEPHENRRNAISNLVSEMRSRTLGLPVGNVEIGGALDVPDSPVDPDAICIATLLRPKLDQEEAFMTGLIRYSALVFEPRSFFRQRETATEQERCVQQLVALGAYTTIRSFPAQNVVFCSRTSMVLNASNGGI